MPRCVYTIQGFSKVYVCAKCGISEIEKQPRSDRGKAPDMKLFMKDMSICNKCIYLDIPRACVSCNTIISGIAGRCVICVEELNNANKELITCDKCNLLIYKGFHRCEYSTIAEHLYRQNQRKKKPKNVNCE